MGFPGLDIMALAIVSGGISFLILVSLAFFP